MNETELEKLCLDWFREGGWDVLNGQEVAPDSDNPLRDDYSQVILKRDLEASFNRINKGLPQACFDQVLLKLQQEESLDIATNNHAFHRLLLNGVPVEYKNKHDENICEWAFLIDFDNLENNRFVVINQFTVSGAKQLRRPDVICFVNGLPLGVLELKSPSDETADIWDAFNQLQTYKDEVGALFTFNEALVISDGATARVGSLTANRERFMPWRSQKNKRDKTPMEWQLESMVRGFFNREQFLDFIRYFVLFEKPGGRIIKKIAGYHQFHAVRAAVKATIAAVQGNEDARNLVPVNRDEVIPGNKKAGVVWHTQGSGKSITMCCYAGKLLKQEEMKSPTIVVVTDRNNLDGQLFETFSSADELLGQTPVQANSREELRQLISERESGGIIFTTVQKFALMQDETEHPSLNSRDNIVVISDEAHRSQYGLDAKLKRDGQYKFGYAKHMRDALPNASFIGFTATPVSQDDKDTRAVFGDYVSIYDIQDGVDDGATVQIFYESRLAKLELNSKEIETLSDQVDEVIEDEEDFQREKTKGEWSRLEKLVGAKPRLQQVAADLVEHFEERTSTLEGKAMIVGMSREICVQLYDEIVALRPQWGNKDPEKGAIKIVMTGASSDKKSLQPHIYSHAEKKRLERRFKNEHDPLKLVIVRDMWLTGFDAPCCHTMYIDKPMKGHNLMQAIARVNRVFKDKPGGLVVDYIGIASELRRAVSVYTDSKGRGKPTHNAEEALAVLLEKIDALRGMFAKSPQSDALDISAFETDAQNLLIKASNHVLSLDDGKKRFFDLVLSASKAYSLCRTLDGANGLSKEMAFFSALKALISKSFSVDKKLIQEEKDTVLKQILDNSVIADGVEDVFSLCDLDKPNIGLLSDEFLEDIRKLPHRNLAVELLEKLLKDGIKARARNNNVRETKYSERLREALRKYHNRAIETALVIEELIRIAKDFREEMESDENSDLTPDEIAFYEALANNKSAVEVLGDLILKEIARKITERLRKSTKVDWQYRESVRAELKILVRNILREYSYPPDEAPGAVELVLKQAEVSSNVWSRSEMGSYVPSPYRY